MEFRGVQPDELAEQPGVEDEPAPQWPLTAAKFLEGEYLNRADVVLTRRNGNIQSWAIRWATDSLFSHSALVFHIRQRAEGFSNCFVIEAGRDGVDLTNIRDYALSRNCVIGIKRLRAEWFDEDVQRLVRGHLLDHIKDTYDYWRIAAIAQAVFRRIFLKETRPFRQHKHADHAAHKKKRRTLPNEFICSGLVQFGFFRTIYKLIRQGRLYLMDGTPIEPEALRQVVFRDDMEQAIPGVDVGADADTWQDFLDGLMMATPKDLEESEKLEWLYLIAGGLAHRVRNIEDVRRITSRKIAAPTQPLGP